jgi:hypothetical protein
MRRGDKHLLLPYVSLGKIRKQLDVVGCFGRRDL